MMMQNLPFSGAGVPAGLRREAAEMQVSGRAGTRAGTPAPLDFFRASLAIAVFLAVLLLAGPARATFDPIAEAGVDRLPDARLPGAVQLLDQAGRPVRLAELFGGPPLVFAPVVYRCPNLCGITLDGLFAGLAGAGLRAGRDYRVVAVGIDPRESPADAAGVFGRLALRWGIPADAVQFMTGPAAGLGAVMSAMGVRSGWDAEHQQYAHISAAAVTTPDGRLSRWLMGVQFDPRTLRLALVEAGHGKVGTLGDQVLLLCYGYDPVRGRYGWLVQRILQAGGAATLGGLALFLWLSFRRQRRGVP
jgi:protein SCO1